MSFRDIDKPTNILRISVFSLLEEAHEVGLLLLGLNNSTCAIGAVGVVASCGLRRARGCRRLVVGDLFLDPDLFGGHEALLVQVGLGDLLAHFLRPLGRRSLGLCFFGWSRRRRGCRRRFGESVRNGGLTLRLLRGLARRSLLLIFARMRRHPLLLRLHLLLLDLAVPLVLAHWLRVLFLHRRGRGLLGWRCSGSGSGSWLCGRLLRRGRLLLLGDVLKVSIIVFCIIFILRVVDGLLFSLLSRRRSLVLVLWFRGFRVVHLHLPSALIILVVAVDDALAHPLLALGRAGQHLIILIVLGDGGGFCGRSWL
eukprot:m.108015 g.108015  ORF g.108015 m.108015 type:complete len:311 (-) comp15859_c0_seq1:825-1757(-)